ncbi:LacI family DNA-binding transcriptional regulator [Cytobacillus firmus]|uniref:Sucrose operon repressor ScrR, LacI family n=1 Tax=Cytobacillus firmus TaxID=1399 RepID=A0A800MY85_CYTFI|nr:LacI family DNA-binding transcriptional regulator [Cytobacillus firmus]KAF0824644.1 Sucrose operon repressor ScrR, LacI family [Cytobacillus firmus]MBG9549239.1 hypothetical protein [Cytobacillus firmus]MBG9602087.1 hypothetical protein [Cytobacillus firmus]MBG9654535.1 hypothetical protein [Cytobacillus firmus]MDD9310117.1 LacI family DNA-binding transcriptional regulator [Cytobacillus firmus]
MSRYLNNKGYISQKSELKIRDVMERLNYHPNEIARGLAKKKTRTIALIIPDITNPFFPELVVAIEEVAKSKGTASSWSTPKTGIWKIITFGPTIKRYELAIIGRFIAIFLFSIQTEI